MTRDLPDAYNALRHLLDAGVPVVRALRTAAPRRDRRLRRTFLAAAEEVEAGNTLADAFAATGNAIPELDAAMIRVGENSGRLPDVLDSLAQWHDLTARLQARIRAGLVYPVVLLHAAAFLVPLPGFVLGNLSPMDYLRAAGSFLQVVYVPLAVWLLLQNWPAATRLLQRVLDPLLLTIPGLGGGLKAMALAQFCSGFRALYSAGASTEECARQAASLCGSPGVARLVRGGADAARRGDSVSSGFSPSAPPELVAAWQTGEESGRLEPTLARLASIYVEQAENRLTEFARWLPRLIYIGVVAYLAYSILTLGARVFGTVYGAPDAP